jgi:hypothetical protein
MQAMRRKYSQLVLTFILVYCFAPVYPFSQTPLRVQSQLLSNEAPFSFPEKMIVGPEGEIYVLDTDLATLFVLDSKTGKSKPLCGPEKLSSPSDFAVDRNGGLWVLSALRSKITKLTQKCAPQTEIVSKRLPLKIAANSLGEIIVLKGDGNELFEIYDPGGKLVRRFGQRLDYKDETTNAELSDGRIVPDTSGGFFFSFNYPPLIRHYSRNGNLIREFKPESDIPIGPPNVSVQKHGNAISVSAKYQILVLDMAADRRGRLYVLLSGKNKTPALTEGTHKLAILERDGRILSTAELENNCHGVAVANRRLYLLRNRKPLRLDAYAIL